MRPQSRVNKREKIISNQTKKILCKNKINQWIQPIDWEKIFINYVYDKELASEYIKNPKPSVQNTNKNFTEKYAKDLN